MHNLATCDNSAGYHCDFLQCANAGGYRLHRNNMISNEEVVLSFCRSHIDMMRFLQERYTSAECNLQPCLMLNNTVLVVVQKLYRTTRAESRLLCTLIDSVILYRGRFKEQLKERVRDDGDKTFILYLKFVKGILEANMQEPRSKF